MLIDFHTHAFPDKLAKGTLEFLSEKSGGLKPVADGTIAGIKAKMREWSVDKSVLLSIATNARQQTNVNNFAIAQNGNGIIAFGSAHPDSPEAISEIERVAAAGLKGIKFHPEYQGFAIDEKKAYPLYERCCELGLVMVFHAGRDLGFPDSLAASPRAVAKVLADFPTAKMVMAHMGGCMLWDEVEDTVAGKGGYLDTSFTAGYLPREQGERIIRKHGVENILFGSDNPWASPAETARYIDSMRLTDGEKDRIFSGNAMHLLGLK